MTHRTLQFRIDTRTLQHHTSAARLKSATHRLWKATFTTRFARLVSRSLATRPTVESRSLRRATDLDDLPARVVELAPSDAILGSELVVRFQLAARVCLHNGHIIIVDDRT